MNKKEMLRGIKEKLNNMSTEDFIKHLNNNGVKVIAHTPGIPGSITNVEYDVISSNVSIISTVKPVISLQGVTLQKFNHFDLQEGAA